MLIYGVALRKESVDRNTLGGSGVGSWPRSLSARRAWIEIFLHDVSLNYKEVALRKESVDRNTLGGSGVGSWPRRSPQGERG